MLEVAIDLCWVPAKLENPVEISHLALIFQIELVVTSFHLGYAGRQYVSLWAQALISSLVALNDKSIFIPARWD